MFSWVWVHGIVGITALLDLENIWWFFFLATQAVLSGFELVCSEAHAAAKYTASTACTLQTHTRLSASRSLWACLLSPRVVQGTLHKTRQVQLDRAKESKGRWWAVDACCFIISCCNWNHAYLDGGGERLSSVSLGPLPWRATRKRLHVCELQGSCFLPLVFPRLRCSKLKHMGLGWTLGEVCAGSGFSHGKAKSKCNP